MSNLTGPGREAQTFRNNSDVLNTEITGRFFVGLASKVLETLGKKAEDL